MTVSTLLLPLAAGPVVVPEPAAPPPAETNQLPSPVFAVSGYLSAASRPTGCCTGGSRSRSTSRPRGG